MLSENKLTLLKQLTNNASRDELIWTRGYLAGFIEAGSSAIHSSDSPAISVKPAIIYGTETGNSKKVASGLLASFKKEKINAKTIDVFQFDIAKLQKETHALFVMSTQGEGEFPQNAVNFYEQLELSAIDLGQLNFAVLGLGDSSYPLFNNAAVLLDEALEKRGAKRLLPLVKADVDYADTIQSWERDLRKSLGQTAVPSEAFSQESPVVSSNHKQNYTGYISHKMVLNDVGSNKETWHLEITTNQAVAYQPGDALGIIPKNSPEIIERIVSFFNTASTARITLKEQEKTVLEWLEQLNVQGLGKRILQQIGELFSVETDFEKADLVDVLASLEASDSVQIQDLLAILNPISPRLYSISSAPDAHDTELHLTVNLNTFLVDDSVKNGLASGFLAGFPTNVEFSFYIHKNPNFRLPEAETDIILIGPGTGIAPFRSFIAQRDATGATGKNWLFFGEQHFVQDFYYQTEIQDWLSSGVLTRLDTAFSRDQPHKIYVQDRILENAETFNSWLENGAGLYICGQKRPMSEDVESSILQVISQQRNISIEAAKAILETLEIEGRYQKDVY